MKGGTLLLSRAIKLFAYYEKYLKSSGFQNIAITAQQKDGLNFVIRDMKPDLVIVDAGFYQCATPFMMKELLKTFPGLNITAVSWDEYPAGLAMYFILNGIKSYVYWWDGEEEFRKGMACVKYGRKYVSPEVQECIEIQKRYPPANKNITDREMEVLRLLSCGFKDEEIVNTLHISRSTVDLHRRKLYKTMNVRNAVELVRVAIFLELVRIEETYFYPETFILNAPLKNNIEKTGGRNAA